MFFAYVKVQTLSRLLACACCFLLPLFRSCLLLLGADDLKHIPCSLVLFYRQESLLEVVHANSMS